MARPATGTTPIRYIRIPDDVWSDLAPAAEAIGANRAQVVNELVRWFLHRTSNDLPQRPTPEIVAEIVAKRSG